MKKQTIMKWMIYIVFNMKIEYYKHYLYELSIYYNKIQTSIHFE